MAMDIQKMMQQAKEMQDRMQQMQIALAAVAPKIAKLIGEGGFNVAINGDILLSGVKDHPVASGDTVELMVAMAGG